MQDLLLVAAVAATFVFGWFLVKKLEDFVKEYICMEQDIHIEDMQQSVMEYGRMRQKIEDTCREIERLKDICGQHGQVESVRRDMEAVGYYSARLDIMQDRLKVAECQTKIQVLEENGKKAVQAQEEEQEPAPARTDEGEQP